MKPNSAALDRDSPAAQAGLKKGDVLIELNGLNAGKTGLVELYSILCNEDKLICVVRRDSKELRLIISQPHQVP